MAPTRARIETSTRCLLVPVLVPPPPPPPPLELGCKDKPAVNTKLTELRRSKSRKEAEEVYTKRSPLASTHVTSVTITTCIRKPDGKPYWSFTVNDVMSTGANQSSGWGWRQGSQTSKGYPKIHGRLSSGVWL